MRDYVELMVAAACLTNAAVGEQANHGIAISANPGGPTAAEINSAVWETFRVFYAGLVGASADPTDWPNPIRPQAVAMPANGQSLGIKPGKN